MSQSHPNLFNGRSLEVRAMNKSVELRFQLNLYLIDEINFISEVQDDFC